MKKAVKSYGMILGMSIAITAVGAMVDSFRERRERQKVKAEDERSSRAFLEFLKWNELEQEDFTHLTDSGYTSIYGYSAENFQPEKARVPKGYVLLKLKHSSGVVNYAYGLEWQKNAMFPEHRILFYLEDEAEWNKDEEYEEDLRYEEEFEQEET